MAFIAGQLVMLAQKCAIGRQNATNLVLTVMFVAAVVTGLVRCLHVRL